MTGIYLFNLHTQQRFRFRTETGFFNYSVVRRHTPVGIVFSFIKNFEFFMYFLTPCTLLLKTLREGE